jgi:hypothetical protein
VVCFGKEWFGFRESLSFLWVVPIPFLVGLAGTGLLGFLFPSPKRESIDGLTLSDPKVVIRLEE